MRGKYGTILKILFVMEIILRNGVAGSGGSDVTSVRRRTKSTPTLTSTASSDVTLTQSDVDALKQLDQLNQKELGTFSEQDLLGDLQNACTVVGGLLPGDATCTCGLDLSSGIRITYNCQYQSPLCLFKFCSVPSIGGFFAIGRIDVSTEFCFLENEWRGNNNLPGLCITLSGEVVKDSNRTSVSITTGNGSSSSSNNNPTTVSNNNDTSVNARTPSQNDLHNVLAENRKRKKSLVTSLGEASVTEASISSDNGSSSSSTTTTTNKILSCTGQSYEDNGAASGTSCNSCEICHSGIGIKFDCSNIYPGYVQSRCKSFPIFGRYTADLSFAKSQFLPVFDLTQ